MARRKLTYWLVKLARISGWLLFFLVLLYIVTGFSLCGEPGLSEAVHCSDGPGDSPALRLAVGGSFRRARVRHHLLCDEEMGMDQETNQEVTLREEDLLGHRPAACDAPASRRRFLRCGACALAAIAAGGGTIYYVLRRAESLPSAEIFPHDAPQGELWEHGRHAAGCPRPGTT